MVGFEDNLSNKQDMIGATVTGIQLKNINKIDNLNETPLLHGGDIYLLLTAQAR